MKLVVTLLFLGAAAAYKTYDGYKLLEVIPSNLGQLDFLHSLTNTGKSIDFWEPPSRLDRPVQVLLSPDQFTLYTPQFLNYGLDWTIADENIGLSIMKEHEEIQARRAARGMVFDINDFNTYDDIMGWLDGEALTKCAAAGLTCSKTSIGVSVAGRDVPIFMVSTGANNKRKVYVDATTHAREWLTPATTLYMMDNMFNNYGIDDDVTTMLNGYDWYFVHVVNPDGYEFTWTNDRLHRKNRNPIHCGSGNMGVDLNRNYDHKHGTNGVSHQPCDDTFCGTGNSEPETQNVANWIMSQGPDILVVFTVHSYGNYMLFPWGTTTGWDQSFPDSYPCDYAADHADLDAVSVAGCTAIEGTYNTNWACGNSCETIYTTSGATDDYSKGECNVKFAYNPELRGVSFVVDPIHIPLSFQELWNGFVVMVDMIGNLAEPKL